MSDLAVVPALTVVTATLAALLFAVWRRRGAPFAAVLTNVRRSAPRLVRIDTLRLTHQHAIHLVEVDGQALLVGVSPTGMTVLTNCGAGQQQP